jgi:hypothetical protein
MKKILISILLLTAHLSAAGEGYKAAVMWGKFGFGSVDWKEAYDLWLNGENADPYPEDLSEVDGCAYHDSFDTASGDY